MTSRRNVLRAVGAAAAVASAGCAAPLATSDGGDRGDADRPRTLVAVAHGDGEIEAITYDHVASVGDVRGQVRGGGVALPVTLTDAGVESLTEALRTAGALEDPDSAEIRLYADGERQQTFRLAADLAAVIREGEFDGEFLLHVRSREAAEALREDLTAGATGS